MQTEQKYRIHIYNSDTVKIGSLVRCIRQKRMSPDLFITWKGKEYQVFQNPQNNLQFDLFLTPEQEIAIALGEQNGK